MAAARCILGATGSGSRSEVVAKPVSRAMTDFSDPEQRLDYLIHHGIDAYNKAMEDHFATVVETVNGHAIRLVHSMLRRALHGRRPQLRPPDPGRRPPDRAR